MIETILEFYSDNFIIALIVTVMTLLILIRLFKSARIYLGIKSYIRNTKKLRKKKFNGILLTEKITKKRKKNTNQYSKLKSKGKKLVKKYFTYKLEELPVITRYSYGKLLRRSKKKIVIIVKNEHKTIKKVSMKKGLKNLLQLTDNYKCLDELIYFLHNIPEAILKQQDYGVFIGEEEISIGYLIK